MEGLWTAEFGSSAGRFGGGVAVFQNGKIFGGDSGYFYVGEYRRRGADFDLTLRISPFIEGFESAFNTIDRNLTLELVGSMVDETRATAQGHPREMPDMTLGVKLTRRA